MVNLQYQSEMYEYADQLRELLKYIKNSYEEKLISRIKSGEIHNNKYLLNMDMCKVSYHSIIDNNCFTTYDISQLQGVISSKDNYKNISIMIKDTDAEPYDRKKLYQRQFSFRNKDIYNDDIYTKDKYALIMNLADLNNRIGLFAYDSGINIQVNYNNIIMIYGIEHYITKATFQEGLNNIYSDIDKFIKILLRHIKIIEDMYKNINEIIEDHNLEQFIKEINQENK